MLNIKNLLKEYNLRPNKRMGQNFLINQKVLEKIIKTAKISKKDIILEIGPGLGVLTKELAKRAKKVIAVEKDKKITEILKESLKECKNIEIIEGDILKNIPQTEKVVANIPYYLTSPLIRALLEKRNPPQEIILLVQKEVAQRICAQPPKMTLLSTAVQFYSQPRIISHVSRKSFWPMPKVDSAIIRIEKIIKPKNIDIQNFFQIVKVGFSWPRKQLAKNLSEKLNIEREIIKKALIECNIDIQTRAQNLSINDWKKLTKKLIPQ